jgi:hypothetical protein
MRVAVEPNSDTVSSKLSTQPFVSARFQMNNLAAES